MIMKYQFNNKNLSKYIKSGGDPRSFERTYICCLCHKEYKGNGNNPYPLKSAIYECCNRCNFEKVLPARFELRKNKK